MSQSSTYHNEIYYMYLAIEDRSYNEKIRFVEKNFSVIENLNPEVQAEILYYYIAALNEMEKYSSVIGMSQFLLELIIQHNIKEVDRIDVYNETLYFKSIAHMNVEEFDASRKILNALLRMGQEKKYFQAMFDLNRKEDKETHQKFLATSIGLMSLTAMLIAIELLLVRVFYSDFTPYIEVLRTLSFVMGIGVILMKFWREKKRDKEAIQKTL